ELAEEALRNERQLLRELLILQEQDRKLVAYEIHDGLAQLLAGTMLKLQAAGNLSQDMSNNSRELFDEGLRYLDDALKETRRLISDMRPPILDQSGIVAAIRNLIDEHSGGDGPVIEFQHDSQIEREKLAPPIEGAIFRIVQESLNNATKHSQSDKVRIELKQRHNRIRVEVRDWGVGFDPDKIAEKRFGLKGIRERARLLGGRVDIETAAGQGTCISAELPLLGRIAGLDG
ncbi:MAG: sensor histidine kinase, partial [Thermoguttaceae bacterium]